MGTQRHDSEHLWLALEATIDVAGIHRSSTSKSTTQLEDHMNMGYASHWQENDFAGRMLVVAQRRQQPSEEGSWHCRSLVWQA